MIAFDSAEVTKTHVQNSLVTDIEAFWFDMDGPLFDRYLHNMYILCK